MTKYLISFPGSAMDISGEDVAAVGEAAHAVIREAKDAGVYVFGAMTQYTIGKLLDRHSLKAVSLPLSFVLAPFLYMAAELSNLPLIVAAIGIVMGAFGQVTVNDAMVGKYTSEEWRSRAYAVRYFIGFTAAGASVGLVAWLYQHGGFVTMLHAFAGLCLLVIAAALILPPEIKVKPAGAGRAIS